MRKLNIKFLLCLLTGFVVLSGGMALAHHLQFRRIPYALLRQAQRAEDEGDLPRAVSYLDRYLSFAPRDGEQQARLAQILANPKMASTQRARLNALKALENALTFDESHHELRRTLVTLAIQANRLQTAQDHLKLLPGDTERARLWGQWHEAKGQPDEAITAYRESTRLAPEQVESSARLARLLRQRRWENLPADKASLKRAEDARDADRVMDQLVEKAPQSWQAHIARWDYQRDFVLRAARGNGGRSQAPTNAFLEAVKKASDDVLVALKLAEGELEVRIAAAEVAQLENRLDTAREHLTKAQQLHRRDPRIYRAFAGLELDVEGKTNDAVEKKLARKRALGWLRQGVQELTPPAQYDALWAHASLLLETGGSEELNEASKMINKFRQSAGSPENSASADFLQGRMLVVRQQWAEAARMLERSRPRLESSTELANQIDVLLGQCYSELDEPGQQFATYERLAKRSPQSVAAQLGMAAAARSLGRLQDAIGYYNRVLSADNVPAGIWSERLRLMIIRARQTNRDSDWKLIEETLERTSKVKDVDPTEVAVLRAESLLAQEKPDQAKQVLEQARGANPFRVELWTALATLADRRHDPKEALRVLQQADAQFTKRTADQVELRLTRARLLANERGQGVQNALRQLEQGLESFPESERNRLLNGLAEAQYLAGKYGEARRLWTHLANQEQHRGDLRLRLALFDLSLQEGKAEEMEQILSDIRRLEGGRGTFGLHAEAMFKVWQVRTGRTDSRSRTELLNEADALASQVMAARPAWSAAYLTRAEIETLRGNPDRVIKWYEEARRLGDRNPLVVRQLVEAYRQQGKTREAENVLRSLTREDLARTDLERATAVFALLNRNPQRAVEQALAVVRNDSRDYRDHLWLGQILAAAGPENRATAEQHLRKAIQLAEDQPEPYLALVRLLTAASRQLEAEGLLAQAKSKVLPQQAAALVAEGFSILSKPEEARNAYQAALQAQPNNPGILRDNATFHLQRGEMEPAEKLIRRMVEGNITLSDEQKEWAHTRLALLLSSGDSFDRFKEALPHVGLRLDDNGNVLRDDRWISTETAQIKRFAARVLATQPNWRTRDEAIKRFEELDRRQMLTVDERLILARLYEARLNLAQAGEQLAQLANSNEARVEHLVIYVQSLLRQGRKEEARRQIARLEKTQQATPSPNLKLALVELQARWHEALGEGDLAEKVLRDHVSRKDVDPQEILLLVSTLGRQKKFDRALELLDRIWLCPPEMAGGTSVALLRSTTSRPEHQQQVAKRLEKAIAQETDLKKKAALMIQLGDVFDLQNQFVQAEQQYQEALKIQPDHLLAMNNLSWLLAQRAERGDQALELINRAIDRFGPRGELLDTRAMVYHKLNRPEEALRDLNEAIKETMTPTRCFHLARVHHLAKNREAAARELRRASDLGLQPAQLHPVEQVVHRHLVEELIRQ